MNKTSAISIVTCAIAMTLAGCGGSGGSGGSNSPSPSSNTGQTEAISGARGATVLMLNGSASSTGRSVGRGSSLTGFAMKMAANELKQTRSSASYYESDLNLYYTVNQTSQNSITVDFSTDSSGRNSAGYLQLTLVSGNGYPATIQETFNITAGVMPMNGQETLVVNDSSWNTYRTSGTINAMQTSITFDLNYSGSAVSGRMSANSNGNSVSFTNLYETSSSISSDFVCNGISGHISVNSDRSGFVTWNGGGGQYRLDWDSAGNATVTYPNGQRQAIGNIYSN